MSRLNSGYCVRCGGMLILPYNDYQCCSKCTDQIEAIVQKTRQNKPRPKFIKPMINKVVNSRQILRQLRPVKEFEE